jgi:hypothetical protein
LIGSPSDVLKSRDPDALLDHSVQLLIERVTIKTVPPIQKKTATIRQNPVDLGKASLPVGEEH